uniref:Ig-like domain-containing protein n=1 Tax=Nothoprocta perdicaria TaxID=30464 RepID=A0A8C7E7W1_NOTPE
SRNLGFCSFIITGPTNVTVLAGSEARFNCTVSSKWVIVIWLSNGNPVLTVVNPQGPIITSDRFTSQNYTSTSGFTLELIVHDTRLSDSGRIECSTQQGNESSSAFLWVQVNGSLFIKNSTITVKENKTVEIVCEALGWAPAPDITWMTNDTFIDKSRYVTKQSQGSNGLHNAMSILTLTPTDTEIVTCLADIEALPSPQNATITVFFLNSTVGKWMFVVPCLCYFFFRIMLLCFILKNKILFYLQTNYYEMCRGDRVKTRSSLEVPCNLKDSVILYGKFIGYMEDFTVAPQVSSVQSKTLNLLYSFFFFFLN